LGSETASYRSIRSARISGRDQIVLVLNDEDNSRARNAKRETLRVLPAAGALATIDVEHFVS
jgi:hypothetical protein